MPKQFSVSIDFVVGKKVTKRQIAAEIEKVIESIASTPADIGDVTVKTIDRVLKPGGLAAGYESRLWEKATCAVAARPGDVVINPVIRAAKKKTSR
jgi:hypothetical protein